MKRIGFAIFGLLAPAPESAAQAAADLVILNAHVFTVDDAKPEAEAVAVRGERIAVVGTNVEVRALVGRSTIRSSSAGSTAIWPWPTRWPYAWQG